MLSNNIKYKSVLLCESNNQRQLTFTVLNMWLRNMYVFCYVSGFFLFATWSSLSTSYMSMFQRQTKQYTPIHCIWTLLDRHVERFVGLKTNTKPDRPEGYLLIVLIIKHEQNNIWQRSFCVTCGVSLTTKRDDNDTQNYTQQTPGDTRSDSN